MAPRKSTIVCRSCNRELPRAAFDVKYAMRRGKKRLNGLHNTCRECQVRFAERVSRPEYIVDTETGCWNWNRGLTPNGYGITARINGHSMCAHRMVYIRHRGPIPEGMTLDHLCRNKACVNPDHLEPVPQAINSQRSSRAILTAEQVQEIRTLRGTIPYREIAEIYGVGYSTVASIMNRSRWWNIDDAA